MGITRGVRSRMELRLLGEAYLPIYLCLCNLGVVLPLLNFLNTLTWPCCMLQER